jgi:hypothetical protein
VIAEDIKLVKQHIPDTFMLKTHILAVLQWSIDKQYPPAIWDKKICPDCEGEGYTFFVDQGEPDPASKCTTCDGKGLLPPKPTKKELWDEQLKKLADWLKSDEGKKIIKESLAKTSELEKIIDSMNDIDPKILTDPFTI